MKIAHLIQRIRPRAWALVGIALVVIVGGATTWALVGASGSRAAETQPTSQSVAASLETLEKSVMTTGTLAPVVQEEVDFAVAGTVTAVNVQPGDTVAAGDVLATVDTLLVRAALLEAEAELAKAQATLASARAADDGSDQSASRIAADEAAVAVAQVDVDDAAADIDDATLVAPAAGLITAVDVEVGDGVTGAGSGASATAGSTVGGTGAGTSEGTTTASTAAFTLVSTDAWQVAVTVGETDVVDIAVGDQVELSTDEGTSFFGTVSSVGLLPSTTSGTVAYPVIVAVTGSPEGLHDGVSVTATIVYERRTDVLTVPSAAVTTDADGVSTVTVIADDGTETQVAVTVGDKSDTLIEIIDGLAEGDLVQVAVFQGGGSGDGGTGRGDPGTNDGTSGFPGGGTRPDGFEPGQMGRFPSGTGDDTTGGD